MLAYTYPLLDCSGRCSGSSSSSSGSGCSSSSSRTSSAAVTWVVGQGLWVIFVIILPFLGILIYLIARGGKMHERAAEAAQSQQQAMDQYIKQAAGTTDTASQLAQLSI